MLYKAKSNLRGRVWGGFIQFFTWVANKLGACCTTELAPNYSCSCKRKPIYTMGSPNPRMFTKCTCKSTSKRSDITYAAQYSKPYHSFSGTDIHFIITPHGGKAYLGAPVPPGDNFSERVSKYMKDNPKKVILEIQRVSFTATRNSGKEPKVRGTIITSFFDEEPIVSRMYEGPNDFVLFGNNEYGHRVYIRFNNVKVEEYGLGVSVDDLCIDMPYVFTAESVEFSTASYIPPKNHQSVSEAANNA